MTCRGARIPGAIEARTCREIIRLEADTLIAEGARPVAVALALFANAWRLLRGEGFDRARARHFAVTNIIELEAADAEERLEF